MSDQEKPAKDRPSRISTMRPPPPPPSPRREPPRPLRIAGPPRPGAAPLVVPSDRPTPRSTVIPRLPAPMTLSGMRPQLPTLIFHGAPPLPPLTARSAAMPPPPPHNPPVRGPRSPYAPRSESALDLQTVEILGDDDDDDEDEASLRPTPFHPGVAKTERPPPPSMRAPPRSRHALEIGAGALAAVFLVTAIAIVARDPAPTVNAPVTTTGAASIASSTGPAPVVVPAGATSHAAIRPAHVTGACTMGAASRLLARRAIVRGGIEATAFDDRVAFAALTGAKAGTAFELDAATLAVRGSAKVVGTEALRRVVPELADEGPVDVMADTGALRTVPDAEGDSAVGARDGYVVWGPRDGDGMVRLWHLEWPATIESPRVALLGASGERAVVFRRSGAIWIGAFRGGQTTSELARLSAGGERTPVRGAAPGVLVGNPTLDAHGDEAIIAWAQRDATSAPWSVRWARWTPRSGPGVVHELALPAGGPGERAMAPSIAALEGGRFLLAWTEAGHGKNQVRAQAFDAADHPLGDALAISAEGAVAGQEQIALADAGKGAVAFLVARRGAFELRASSIDCGP